MSEIKEMWEAAKKPGLTPISHAFDMMREEGLAEEARNEGFVWTIRAGGTTSLSVAGLAKVDYTLDLNCSHVGPTPYGIYRGEMSFRFDGSIGGVKAMLGLLGFRSSEDVSGWFKNDKFVMRLSEYTPENEAEFIEYFVNGGNNVIAAPGSATDGSSNASTGDPNKDAAYQAGQELANGIVNAVLGSIKNSQQDEADKATSSNAPTGIWHDFDYRMTEGDMGTYLKFSGGRLFWRGGGQSGMSSEGHAVKGNATVHTIAGTESAVVDEDVLFPFPYVLKVYPNNRVRFTLYNYKGGPITVDWLGWIDSIPVSQTTVVK
jgi:hypothetical protein